MQRRVTLEYRIGVCSKSSREKEYKNNIHAFIIFHIALRNDTLDTLFDFMKNQIALWESKCKLRFLSQYIEI